LREVAFVIVHAIYGKVIGITVCHRPVIERLETLPLAANRNTSAAVNRMGKVGASRVHQLPDVVNARPGFAMGSVDPLGPLDFFTSTVRRLSISEVSAKHCSLGPALASAKPEGAAAQCVSGLPQHGPIAAGAASHVDKTRVFCHAAAYIDIAGSASLQRHPARARVVPEGPLMPLSPKQEGAVIRAICISLGLAILGAVTVMVLGALALKAIADWIFA
jgi:hypothetical protein